MGSPNVKWFDEHGNKRCSSCKEYKPLSSYHADKTGISGKAFNCKPCANAASRKSHHSRKHDPIYVETKRDRYIKSKWGMTAASYDSLLEKQSNTCPICKTVSPKGGWHLDHNHNTGRVRQFLCNPCNRGLGYLQDNEEILMNAIEYLKTHKSSDDTLKEVDLP